MNAGKTSGFLGQRFKKPLHRQLFIVALILAALLPAAGSGAFTLNVQGVNPDGTTSAIVNSYRWVVEEDATYHVDPGVPDPNTLSVSFHTSYMPVVASGDETMPLPGEAGGAALDPAKYYYVSVLPKNADPDAPRFTLGGAQIAPSRQGSAIDVVVNKLPLPTAQISVFVYQDNHPINNAQDLPEEQGLEGFSIVLEDAGGRYGMSAGTKMTDGFGNMLGTTYVLDGNGQPVLNPDGTPQVKAMGDGVIRTGPDGVANIKYLAQGKYGVSVVPPAGQGWIQTSTIEGTRVIDAWVKPNEPAFFQEFGPPGYHAAIGFIQPFNDLGTLPAPDGRGTITGQIVNLHMSRPPDYAFYNGAPLEHTTPWVGLNLGSAGTGQGVLAMPCNADGTFTIPDVPAGDYQLVVWDEALDIIFAFHTVTVLGDSTAALGDIPVFQWFTRQLHYVYNDVNENGFRDPGEMGIPNQTVNIRWRDGTMNQSAPTDAEGFVPFDEIFPFFAWQVAEVDFARFKATGVTVTVDDGGPIDPTDPWSFDGQLNPQIQADTGLPYRTETSPSPVLLEAFQGFIGQTSAFQWGKTAYGPGPDGQYGTADDENGGISGVVYYSTTRAENDPELGAAEPWEPGIPNVTVGLWGLGPDGLANTPDDMLLGVTETDSWDANPPAGAQGEPFTFMGSTKDCYDGLRNFNQVRPGVFDGGYAFSSCLVDASGAPVDIRNITGTETEVPLPAGQYMVEVVPPDGYEIVKAQDKNVDFGDDYVPAPELLAPRCVGEPYDVPAELALFPGITHPFYDPESSVYKPGYDPLTNPYVCHLCNRKMVVLNPGENSAADFFLFTEAPIAGHIYGFILDDTANEFDPNAPTFGEKYAPPWLPISIRDWTGREIARTYSDQYGVYNALVPSTYTANQAQPSGMAPNMITVSLNSPTRADGTPDPFFNPQYSQFNYTLQYMPGTTTYLDTPVVPVAAFAGPNQYPLDCAFADGTPKIKEVVNGPYVSAPGQTITLLSEGPTEVPNPAYDGVGGVNPKLITRDYGFGNTAGTVTIGTTPLSIQSWSADQITAQVPAGAQTGQLLITRGDNTKSSVTGITVTVGQPGDTFNVIRVAGPGNYPATPIQDAIDSAAPGDLILVPPGNYQELVVMWKPVKLQGYGTASTRINATKTPAEKLAHWRARVTELIANGDVDLLPAQEIGGGVPEPITLFTEEGPGIIVLAKTGLFATNPGARIDGFTITGADHAGGIMVNGYADSLEISNNMVANNAGIYAGGIRIGHPTLINADGLSYADAHNDNIRIHHNHITQNGGQNGAGGGVSICTGADNYQVTDNCICGNFTMGSGGGIGHLGLSSNGLIADNHIIFNESFLQGTTVNGGGVYIAGQAPLVTQPLGPGSGDVTVDGNLIQGNAAGAGDGGGIRTERINGEDAVAGTPYLIKIYNNMIVNNVAGLAGGGISLQDTARCNILHNTIAHNDSTATAGEAFAPGSPNQSTPQPAGIASRAHSPALAAALPGGSGFSNPLLVDDIIYENRSFYFQMDPNAVPPTFGLMPGPADPVFWDLGVLGTSTVQLMNPQYCLLTDKGGYDNSNSQSNPRFVSSYFNGDRGQTIAVPEITTAIQAPPALDEGGNFIKVNFGPLTLWNPATGMLFGDYHIERNLPGARNFIGDYPELFMDYDGDLRNLKRPDIGADERIK